MAPISPKAKRAAASAEVAPPATFGIGLTSGGAGSNGGWASGASRDELLSASSLVICAINNFWFRGFLSILEPPANFASKQFIRWRHKQLTLLEQWLCHTDALQVYDLPPADLILLSGLRPHVVLKDLSGKSETCREPAWQSHFSSRLRQIVK